MKPFVFKAGTQWCITTPDLDDPKFPSWREAYETAYSIARIREVVSDTIRWL